MTVSTVRVTRTNYDRFVTPAGTVMTGGDIFRMRREGCAFVVTDETPAACGVYRLEALS